MPWTKEQQKVIEQRNADILVSAAAGSGKTAVLVERIIQKIMDEKNPVDVDRLLVVTFTKAAAGEMKERILKALDEKVNEDPGNAHITRQLSLIHKAQITTIDSFCTDVIRNYFYALGLDPAITVGDEGRLTAMKEEVLDEILEEAYEKKDSRFLELVEMYAPGKTDQAIHDYILNLYQVARSHVQPEKWLEEAKESVTVETKEDLEQLPFIKKVESQTKNTLKFASELMEQGITLCKEPKGPYFYKDAFKKELEQINSLRYADSFKEMCEKFFAYNKSTLRGRKKKNDDIDEGIQKKAKSLRDRAIDLVQQTKVKYFFRKESELLRQLRIVKGPLTILVELTKEFLNRFSERKIKDNLMDYGDMEHFALSLLTDGFDKDDNPIASDIAKEKAQSFDEIYIDEYQDSNFIQDAILRCVSRESEGGHNMFMVGDVKQSIYGFRLARPDLFLEKYHRYQKKNDAYQLIELRNNFRSRKEVLTFVNELFYQIMHESLGNIEYTKEVSLVPTLPYPEVKNATPEILLFDGNPKEYGEDPLNLEARMIGRRIKELVDGQEPYMIADGESLRKVTYGDIVILLRSVKGRAEEIQKELMDLGIPTFCDSQKGYFDTVEIRTLLSLLSAVDNIYQDIHVAAVLRSSMIGMNGEELGRLKAIGKKDYLYECLEECMKVIPKAEKAMELFAKLRKAKTYLPLTELVWMALDETDYYNYAGAMPSGATRQGNILMLIEYAKNFENNQSKGLFHFIKYMEECQEYEMDFGEAGTFGEAGNMVHISSIHKSKGLEYPVVFLARCHGQFNMRDSFGSIIFHADYFIGADAVNPISRLKSPTIIKNMMIDQMKKDALGEELRVLYVALTRAREKLIITGQKKQEIEWNNQTPPSYLDLISSKSYENWIFWALPQMDSALYQLKIYEIKDLLYTEMKETVDQVLNRNEFENKLNLEIPEKEVQEIKQGFSYIYPKNAETKGQLKYSVTEIKKMSQLKDDSEDVFALIPKEAEHKIPKFMGGKEKISAASKGTAVHKIFELMDFAKEYSKEKLEKQMDQWIEEEIFKPEYKNIISVEELLAFYNTEIGKRAKTATFNNALWKERQFVMGVPFSQMVEESKGDSYVVVQGVIDLYFEEENKIVIVDYKTDKIKEGEEEILIKRYYAQLDYYKRALEQMTGKTVKECYIYSVPLKKSIEV